MPGAAKGAESSQLGTSHSWTAPGPQISDCAERSGHQGRANAKFPAGNFAATGVRIAGSSRIGLRITTVFFRIFDILRSQSGVNGALTIFGNIMAGGGTKGESGDASLKQPSFHADVLRKVGAGS